MNINQLKKELRAYPPETNVKIIVVGDKAGIQFTDGLFSGQVIIIDQNFKQAH